MTGRSADKNRPSLINHKNLVVAPFSRNSSAHIFHMQIVYISAELLNLGDIKFPSLIYYYANTIHVEFLTEF